MTNKRINKNMFFFKPLKNEKNIFDRKNFFNCFDTKIYKVINLENNFIDEFNFWLTHRNFNLIMFDNCIFYNTLAKDIYNKFTLIK